LLFFKKKGNIEAQYALAECYHYGDIYEQDYSISFELFEALAKKKHPWAKYMLADCYENGMHFERKKNEK